MIAARSYRADIDGLRTIAVLPVVLFHAGLGFSGGYVGVDIFFVISGFLITGIIDRDIQAGRYSLIRFYERRLRRLYPALFVVLAVTAVIAAWLMIPPDFDEFGQSLMATTVYGSNIFFFFQNGYFNEASHLKPLLHTWSLSVEEQFYILFPPLLWLVSRFLSRRMVVALVLLAVLVSFAGSAIITSQNENFAFYLLPTRAWELGLGALLALGAFPSLKDRPRTISVLSVAALVMIFVAVFTYDDATIFPGTAALWPCLGTVILLWVGRDGQGMVTKLLSQAPMVFVGKISYSLYLWHWPVIVFATYGAAGSPSLALSIFCVVLSGVLATLSWRYIENPVRDGIVMKSGKSVFVWGGIASAAAIAIGAAIHLSGGLPQRTDQALMAMVEPTQYRHENRACHNVTLARVRDGDVCILGSDNAAPSFVLVGDSHGDALSPGIFAAAKEAGVAGWQFTAPGFVPLLGVRTLGHADSRSYVDALRRFLSATPEAETVIVTAYWQHYFTGYTYRHRGTIMVDEANPTTSVEGNPDAVIAGLSRLVTAFPDTQFVFLDDVPTGNLLYLKHYARSVSVPWRAPLEGMGADEAVRQRAGYETHLQDFAARFDNVTYQPLLTSVCREDLCTLFDEAGQPRFRDGDHLSATGAMALAPNLAPLFAAP